MAAVVQGTQVGIRQLDWSPATVGSSPFSKLGYYIDCINTCVDLVRDDAFMLRYNEADSWDGSQKDQVVALALLLGPDVVLGKVVHLLPDDHPLLEGRGNMWYELSAVRTTLAVTEQVVIGGEQKVVSKIMVCKESWYENNFLRPMTATVERLKAPSQPRPQRQALPPPQPRPQPRSRPPPRARARVVRRSDGGEDPCLFAFVLVVVGVVTVAASAVLTSKFDTKSDVWHSVRDFGELEEKWQYTIIAGAVVATFVGFVCCAKHRRLRPLFWLWLLAALNAVAIVATSALDTDGEVWSKAEEWWDDAADKFQALDAKWQWVIGAGTLAVLVLAVVYCARRRRRRRRHLSDHRRRLLSDCDI